MVDGRQIFKVYLKALINQMHAYEWARNMFPKHCVHDFRGTFAVQINLFRETKQIEKNN